MSKRDYYEILGVSKSADEADIKRAYRRLAKKHHPDRNPNDAQAEKRFKEVQEAYDVLSDTQKRSTYDNFGHSGVDGAPGAASWGGTGQGVTIEDLRDMFENTGASPFGDIFGDFVGGRGAGPFRRRRAGPSRGQDVEHTVNMSFEQAVHGASFEIDMQSGPGTAQANRQTLTAKIPPGVRNGQKIRLKGKGQAGAHGGTPGDLYIICNVRPHRVFSRRNDDIQVEVPISIAEAALGARIEVPSLQGRTTVTVPPGTASGTRLRLKGHGIRNATRNTQGDQFVLIRIVPPRHLSPKQEEALREMLEENPRLKMDW